MLFVVQLVIYNFVEVLLVGKIWKIHIMWTGLQGLPEDSTAHAVVSFWAVLNINSSGWIFVNDTPIFEVDSLTTWKHDQRLSNEAGGPFTDQVQLDF